MAELSGFFAARYLRAAIAFVFFALRSSVEARCSRIIHGDRRPYHFDPGAQFLVRNTSIEFWA
jgi:hypothetical protein